MWNRKSKVNLLVHPGRPPLIIKMSVPLTTSSLKLIPHFASHRLNQDCFQTFAQLSVPPIRSVNIIKFSFIVNIIKFSLLFIRPNSTQVLELCTHILHFIVWRTLLIIYNLNKVKIFGLVEVLVLKVILLTPFLWQPSLRSEIVWQIPPQFHLKIVPTLDHFFGAKLFEEKV